MPGEDDKTKTDGTGATTTTTDDKPAVTFKTREEFHREVDRKANAASKKAVDDFKATFLEQLGIESEDDLPKLKETIASSAKTVTEAEKLKAQLDKTTKEHGKAIARGDALQTKLKGIAKRDALAPFMAKVRDPEALAMFADRHLDVDDEGAVTVKDGGKVEDWVETFLKGKEYLRVPAATNGAGTTAVESRKPNDGGTAAAKTQQTTAAATTTEGTDAAKTNGKPPTNPREWASALVQEMKASREGSTSGP